MRNLILMSLSLLFGLSSYGQNYSIPLGGVGYLSCEELEETVIRKSQFKKGWDDYELNSSFLEKLKIYETQFYYSFVLVKFKNKDNYYVYCGISNEDMALFEVFVDTGKSFEKMFNEYISPYKCDCK